MMQKTTGYRNINKTSIQIVVVIHLPTFFLLDFDFLTLRFRLLTLMFVFPPEVAEDLLLVFLLLTA